MITKKEIVLSMLKHWISKIEVYGLSKADLDKAKGIEIFLYGNTNIITVDDQTIIKD